MQFSCHGPKIPRCAASSKLKNIPFPLKTFLMSLTLKKLPVFSMCASLHPLTSAPWRRMNAVDVSLASCHVAELQGSTNHMNWFPNPLRFQKAQTSLDRIMTGQYEEYCSVITALNRPWLWLCCFDGYNLGLYHVKQLCLLWATLSPV